MLNATDIVGHPGGERPRRSRPCARAACASPASRCCATSRGCRATCTPTRSTSPRRCSRCATRSARACCSCCSSTSAHATATDSLVKDLRKLAMLAVPLGIRVAYEALSWGRHVNEYPQAWDMVARGRPRQPRPRASTRSTSSPPAPSIDALEEIVRRQDLPGAARRLHVAARSARREERIDTARHFRVFPGEGVHSAEVAQLVRTPRRAWATAATTASRCSTTTTRQLPLAVVAERARRSVKWLTDQVSRRSLPLRGAAH